MSNYALFMGWNRAIPGREMDSIETFGGFSKYLDTLKEQGTIEAHEPYFLDFHGGDLNGFWLIHGDLNKLNELRETSDWQTWISKGQYTMQGFGVLPATTGEALATRMTSFQKVIKK